jgi:predicted amidohydrolase YtcJ
MLTLVNGILIDGTGAGPMAGAVLLIQGEHILAVGPRMAVNLPSGARTHNLQGAAMLPA